jgi:hypothetical protein
MTDAPSPPDKDARMWATICHLAALAGYAIPFGHVIGPLVVWLIKKDHYPLVMDQGREALNFQITVTLAVLVALLLTFICIGIPLLIAIGVADLVFIILAALQANKGVAYRYPLCLRLIK